VNKYITKFNLFFCSFEEAALVSCLLLLVVLAFVNIMFRTLDLGGIFWVDQFLINLVLWIAMLGGCVACRSGGHINIDLIAYMLPLKFQPYIFFLTNLISAVVCLMLAYVSVQLIVLIEYPDHRPFIPYLEAWVPMLIMPYGFTVMGLRFGARMVAVCRVGPI